MTHPLIAAALAAPMTHQVVTLYADGSSKTHETRGEAEANNWAIGERRKIGLVRKDRDTGIAVEVVDVVVEPIKVLPPWANDDLPSRACPQEARWDHDRDARKHG